MKAYGKTCEVPLDIFDFLLLPLRGPEEVIAKLVVFLQVDRRFEKNYDWTFL